VVTSHDLTQLDDYIPPELIGVPHLMTPEQFERLCRKHRDLRLELTSTGELVIMPGTGAQTGRRSANLTYQLEAWARRDGSGVCFGCSTLFALPNNARRMPHASWLRRERWERLSKREREDFGRFCPDFVVVLRSETDRLPPLLSKMDEYVANGAAMGWLIDPLNRRVHIYRPGHEPLVLENPEVVSGDPLLPGLRLEMEELW
jgi:Uma2 family endonuclease